MLVPNGLSPDQAPPYSAPMRFFITAPLFAIVAGCLLFFIEPSQITKNTPLALAYIHLLTLGFAGFVMIGALQQMLPVLAGVNFAKPKLLASFLHITFVIGVLLIALGFGLYEPILLTLAILFLVIPLFIFGSVVLYTLFKVTYKNKTVQAMQYAIGALFVVSASGALLLFMHASGNFLGIYSHIQFIHLHFAAYGWILLLIVGVSFQIIPMFWGSSDYSEVLKKYLPYFIGALLLAQVIVPSLFFSFLLTISAFVFGTITFLKLHNRKRKVFDIAVVFWKIGVISLMIASILIGVQITFQGSFDVQIFVTFGIGFVMSVIYGMLYKIIPFLTWFHLSGRGIWDIPSIKEMIEKSRLQTQLALHGCAIVFLSLEWFTLGAIFFVCSNILFFANIAKPILLYTKSKNYLI